MSDYTVAPGIPRENQVVLECLHSVLQEIGAAAAEHDVTGILLGTRDDHRVRILASRRLVPKRFFGRSGVLSDADREAFARLIAGPPADGELYGLEPVGWFRAQPKRSLVLSDLELELLNSFFTAPAQIGVIIRPAASGPTRARFYVRESHGFLNHVYRDLIVPPVSDGPMLTVAPEAIPPERPVMPAAPPRELAQLAMDRMEEAPPKPPLIAGWVWRAASSLAITSFVLGYWWIAYSRQATERAQRQRPPAALVDADRQQVPPPPEPVDLRTGENSRGADERNPADVPPSLPPIEDGPPARPSENDQARWLDNSFDKQQKLRESPRVQPPPSRPQIVAAKPAPAQTIPAETERATQPVRTLRPLRILTPSRKDVKPAELSAPPLVAHEIGPILPPPLPQSMTVVPPVKTVAPKITASLAPAKGSLIWTGRVRKNATLTIDGSNASFGTLTGGLPGRPVQFRVYPGDLADDGILVYTANSQDARAGWDSAGPQNGWNRVVYEFDPRSAGGVEVEEAPGPANGWKRLVLRCTSSKVSVIYVKWSAAR